MPPPNCSQHPVITRDRLSPTRHACNCLCPAPFSGAPQAHPSVPWGVAAGRPLFALNAVVCPCNRAAENQARQSHWSQPHHKCCRVSRTSSVRLTLCCVRGVRQPAKASGCVANQLLRALRHSAPRGILQARRDTCLVLCGLAGPSAAYLHPATVRFDITAHHMTCWFGGVAWCCMACRVEVWSWTAVLGAQALSRDCNPLPEVH